MQHRAIPNAITGSGVRAIKDELYFFGCEVFTLQRDRSV